MPAHIRIAIAAAIAFAASGGVAAADIAPGTYACFTRGGNEIAGRRFEIGEDGFYGGARRDGGTFAQYGYQVLFKGGPLDGREAARLPGGRLRLSPKVFCRKILDPVSPPPVPEPDRPAKRSAPPAKLIKVKTAPPDPRLIKVGR